ncbi:MAG: ribonuclease III [Oscillospiraceae bacterium]|nr:ribonuclease III [Oscillospiraceae bacterium]
MTEKEINAMSALALAHMGDAVFELQVRTMLCTEGLCVNRNLHKETIARVCAPAQAAFADRLLPSLTAEELAVYKRGRNAHVHAIPKNATASQYGKATGLEALFGWLHLMGRQDRIDELFRAGQKEEE